MKHPVLETLDAFGLNDTATLHSKISQMDLDDWETLLVHFDNGYRQTLPLPPHRAEQILPLSFNFPPLSGSQISGILPYVLIGEKTFLDDPLYDYLALIEEPGQQLTQAGLGYPLSFREIALRGVLPQIENIILFYIRTRDLIGSNHLIPYKNTDLTWSLLSLMGDFREIILASSTVQDKLGVLAGVAAMKPIGGRIGFDTRLVLRPQVIRSFFPLWRLLPDIVLARLGTEQMKLKAQQHAVNQIEKLLESSIPQLVYSQQLTAVLLWQLGGDLRGMSTDLLSAENAHIFRVVADSIFKGNSSLDDRSRLPFPGDINLLGIDIPLLKNTPPERILEMAYSEKDAYENFRGALNEKLLTITAPSGSKEREIQIERIRESISKGVSDLSFAYRRLQRDFSRRFALNLAIASSSILIAGLATVGRNLDAISIASGMAAGTGLAESIKEFGKDWLTHQKELETLRASDNYFIWKTVAPDKRK